LNYPKTLINSKHILTQLHSKNYNIIPSYNTTNIIIINTYNFINSTITKSLNTINKTINTNNKIIITNYLNKHPKQIHKTYPNILTISNPQN
ncbi:30S ribosomal protein S12 methylthiotransferase RimO, partial [Escherichia coli]|nr:30S ribosomal protein S12 methylthiotransferase RimO [Escherichia coli]